MKITIVCWQLLMELVDGLKQELIQANIQENCAKSKQHQ